MKDEIFQELSELMDNELDSQRGRFLASRLCHDNDLARQWHRFHTIRDVLHENFSAGRVDIRQSLAAALHQEGEADSLFDNHHEAGKNSPTVFRRILKPVIGSAIAASVSLMAIWAVQNVETTSRQPMELTLPDNSIASNATNPVIQEAQLSTASFSSDAQAIEKRQAEAVPLTLTRAALRNQAMERKLNTYLLLHEPKAGIEQTANVRTVYFLDSKENIRHKQNP